MSGPFDDFLSKCVSDCVNGSSGSPEERAHARRRDDPLRLAEWRAVLRQHDDSDMTAEQWRRQEEYDAVVSEERHEKWDRYASGPEDDYRATPKRGGDEGPEDWDEFFSQHDRQEEDTDE